MINDNHGKKNNQTDREIPTLESTDNAGNSVNLVSYIICLPLIWLRKPMLDSIRLPPAH